MKTALTRMLAVAGLGLLGSAGWTQAKVAPDPEDSPLYAASMDHSFAQMTARDGLAAGQRGDQPVRAAALVIVTKGTQWYALPEGPREPKPADLTSGPTLCASTCNERTCVAYPTCGGGSTCTPDATCNGTCTFYPTCLEAAPPAITCYAPTCTGATCGTAPTCSLVNTCSGPPSSTCGSMTYNCTPTCYMTGATCSGATCSGTCVPANCQTALYGVSIPQAGQIQFSFSSSPQLKYVLECCTNPGAGLWTVACSTNGNGGMLTLCHTNGAPMALYRLLIQTP